MTTGVIMNAVLSAARTSAPGVERVYLLCGGGACQRRAGQATNLR